MVERVAYVYKWATLGGVERVLLNRAEAFKLHNFSIHMDVMFLHDSGGKQSMLDYIDRRGLRPHISIVNELNYDQYAAIITIDTPDIFELITQNINLVVECHTTYAHNRRYLSSLPSNVSKIVAPSKHLFEVLAKEFPELVPKMSILRNFVIPGNDTQSPSFPAWTKTPIVYVGRMDAHKNVLEIMDAVSVFRERYGDSVVLLLVGPRSPEIVIEQELSRRSLTNRALVMPSIGFEKTTLLFQGLRTRRAVFVSSSIGESFSLSAAEAISNGLPTVLSDIDAHRFLVDNRKLHLYPIGQPEILADRLNAVIQNYTDIARSMPALAARYGPTAFLEDWNAFAMRMKEHSA